VGQNGKTPLDVANGEAVKKLLKEVRAPGPNPILCLETPLVPTPTSIIANNLLRKLWRALV
jgi:hypothetical protein